MRDLGYDFVWYDKYAENLLARGFEYADQKIKLVTAFELMEHLENPREELARMVHLSDNILFSTVCYDEKFNYKEPDWWYYAQESGQHIMFYSKLTLKYMASLYKLNYYDLGVLHLFSKRKISTFEIELLFKNKLSLPIMYLEWMQMMWKNRSASVKDRKTILQKMHIEL